MPRRPALRRRLATAARWPTGVALTSWAYMWRTTPMRRLECPGDREIDGPPALPDGIDRDEIQGPQAGAGPLFHRLYRIRMRDAELTPVALMERVAGKPDDVAPTEFASFQKVHGDEEGMAVGDEYVVRMPGPWDGPVRVIRRTPTSFRLATLDGHLEAGQIEFRTAVEDGLLTFAIESWARSGDRMVNLLYSHLRMAKEIQFHMWVSFLERVVSLSGGRMTGGVEMETERIELEALER